MKLSAVRRVATALPEVTESPHHQLGSFRVRGKIFVTWPDDEHLHVFVAEAERELALAMHPGFVEKLLWGGKVVGVRVTLPQAEPAVVKRLVQQAWAHKAPRSLQASIANADG